MKSEQNRIKREATLGDKLNESTGIAILLVIIFTVPFSSLYWAISSESGLFESSVVMLFATSLYFLASHFLNKRYDIAAKIESPLKKPVDPKGGIIAVISFILGGILQGLVLCFYWLYSFWIYIF